MSGLLAAVITAGSQSHPEVSLDDRVGQYREIVATADHLDRCEDGFRNALVNLGEQIEADIQNIELQNAAAFGQRLPTPPARFDSTPPMRGDVTGASCRGTLDALSALVRRTDLTSTEPTRATLHCMVAAHEEMLARMARAPVEHSIPMTEWQSVSRHTGISTKPANPTLGDSLEHTQALHRQFVADVRSELGAG